MLWNRHQSGQSTDQVADVSFYVIAAFERTDRKSAVEQLEESKMQYVKSEQVLDHRQLPRNTDTIHIGRCRLVMIT